MSSPALLLTHFIVLMIYIWHYIGILYFIFLTEHVIWTPYYRMVNCDYL